MVSTKPPTGVTSTADSAASRRVAGAGVKPAYLVASLRGALLNADAGAHTINVPLGTYNLSLGGHRRTHSS